MLVAAKGLVGSRYFYIILLAGQLRQLNEVSHAFAAISSDSQEITYFRCFNLTFGGFG